MFRVLEGRKNQFKDLENKLITVAQRLARLEERLNIKSAKLEIMEEENEQLKEKIKMLLSAKESADEKNESVYRDLQAIQNFSLDNVLSEIMKG